MTDVNASWERLVREGFFANYSYEARRRYMKSSAALRLPRTAWLAEIGCGTGRYHRLLREMGYRNVVSCDLTFEHIAQAKALNPDGMFVVASGERLPFKDRTFDGLVTNAAIEHFADPRAGVQEFSRITADDGTLVVTSDCYSWRVLQLLGLYRSKMPIDRTLSYGGFRRLFASAGLVITESDAWGITHYLRRLSRGSTRIEERLAAAMEDSHWSNRRAVTAVINRLRMVALDENLFVLRKSTIDYGSKVARADRGLMSLEAVLACPDCRSSLRAVSMPERLLCAGCGCEYPVRDGVAIFH